MGYIDTAGTYRGEITEHSLGETKNGFPQFVVRLRATQKYLEDLHELQHFHEQGVVEQNEDGSFAPQWVDWTEFDETTTGFLVLFNDPETFDENSKLLNYDQLQLATGWPGDEFDSLNDGTYVGKQVLFRVDEDEYEGQVKHKVNWIDDYEASPSRELKQLDQDRVKDMASKLKMGSKSKKPAKASKPSASKPSQGKPSGETSKTEQSQDQSSDSSSESSSKSSSKPPKKSPPKSKDNASKQEDESTQNESNDSSEETTSEQTEESESLPAEVTQGEAWEFVCNNKGDNGDDAIEDAWISACNEVGEEKDEDDFTKAEWAQVRDIVIRDLALDV